MTSVKIGYMVSSQVTVTLSPAAYEDPYLFIPPLTLMINHPEEAEPDKARHLELNLVEPPLNLGVTCHYCGLSGE